MCRFRVAELIVEDNRYTVFLGQLGKWDQIVMTQAWASVKYDEWITSPVLQIAKAFVVCLVCFALMGKIDLSLCEFGTLR